MLWKNQNPNEDEQLPATYGDESRAFVFNMYCLTSGPGRSSDVHLLG